jgi:chromosome partitioning protein
MGTIVAISNQKGGVGKTTLAVHLAVDAARRGKRVILLDADPQGNATSWLTGGDLSESGIFDLLVVNKTAAACVRLIEKFHLELVPGNARTDDAMRFLAVTGRLDAIPAIVEQMGRSADLVIIDMPPSRSMGFQDLLAASDWVLVPTQLERMALEGVMLMAQTADDLRRAGRGPRLLGVVPNMARPVNEHKTQMNDLINVFRSVVWPPLPMSVRVAEACAFGETVWAVAPKDPISLSLTLVCDRFHQNVWGA